MNLLEKVIDKLLLHASAGDECTLSITEVHLLLACLGDYLDKRE